MAGKACWPAAGETGGFHPTSQQRDLRPRRCASPTTARMHSVRGMSAHPQELSRAVIESAGMR